MGPIWDQDEIEAHKTPASKQRFAIRCGFCYSDAIHSPGVNLDCSFTVECDNCERRSTFKIAEVRREDKWPTVVITVAKEDA